MKHTKDVMQGNNPDKTADYFDGDTYIQHNTAIADESTWQNSSEQGCGPAGGSHTRYRASPFFGFERRWAAPFSPPTDEKSAVGETMEDTPAGMSSIVHSGLGRHYRNQKPTISSLKVR